jgi:hypothetical protein
MTDGFPRTWPISTRSEPWATLIGVPARLGDGQVDGGGERWRTLEEVAGEDWDREVLSLLLPRNRAWGWWTRSEVFAAAGISTSKAGPTVDTRVLDGPVSRRLAVRRMVLVATPADSASQERILDWAGQDTEHVADVLWTAADGAVWKVDDLVDWCLRSSPSRNAAAMLGESCERLVILHDQAIYAAVTATAAEAFLAALTRLAGKWDLEIIPGWPPYGWLAGNGEPR